MAVKASAAQALLERIALTADRSAVVEKLRARGGAHAEETLTEIADFLNAVSDRNNGYTGLSTPEDQTDPGREISALQAAVIKTTSVQKAAILRQLDQLTYQKSP